METLILENTAKIIKEKQELEKKLEVSIKISGKTVSIEGETVKEYEASMILEAISFGFDIKDALSLQNEEMLFRKIHIKDFTRRKNLRDVRARLIGTEGKTRRTVEEISGCSVVIREKDVGIIGHADSIDEASSAITNIIKGTKQANAYHYLERMNAEKKKYR